MPISVKIPVLFLALIALLAGSAGAQSQLIGDLNKDYKVDFKDLRTLAWQWLDPACLEPGCPADIDGSDGVNMVDFALLAKNWQMEQTHLIISEFLASNASQIPLEDGELLDGNGESSDWIEIYNPTSATVSLDGWYLTDNKDNKDKWQFPDGLEIVYGGFLVVFASDKTFELYPSNYPYLDFAGYYHTNFNLEITGEYLALVAPDGNTVIHEYDEYPRQLTDISYGLTQYATTLIPSGADVSFHVPTSGDAGADWTNLSFDDSGWDTGQTGLGFGIGGKQTVAYNDSHRWVGDFTAANVTNWTIHNNDTSNNSGKLKDFATGSEVGMPTVTFTMGSQGLAVSTSAGGNPATGTDAYEIFNNIVDLSGYLVYYGSPGWWVEIEFTGLNPNSLYSFAGTAIRASDYPNRKSLFTIMGHNGAVNNSSDGVVLKTDNTTQLLAGDNRSTGYIVRWDGIIPALDGSFKVRAEATADSEDGKAYPLGGFMLEGGGGDSELQDDMLGVNASLWSRINFNVIDPGNFDTLTLRMRYEDGFVAYLNGEKVASSDNAPNPAEWNSTALTDRPNEDSLVFEEFNLMAFLHLLQPGLNVLAIHGLNDNKDNGDFFILPELVAARNRPVPQYFTTPTPGTFNKPGAIGLVEEVWFSHKRGFYDAPFLLTLSTATKDAEIRYTTDSSTPTITHGSTYVSPILIDKITTLRAVAVKPGWLDSDVETHSYYFLDDVITQATDPVTGAQVVPDGYPTMWVSGADVVTGNYQVDPDVVGQDGTDIFGGLYANTIRDDLKSAPTISVVMDKADWFGDTGIYVNENQDGTERVASFEFVNPRTGENFQVNCAIAMQGGVSGGGTSLDRWKVYKLSMRPRFKDSTDDGSPTGGPRKLDYKFFSDSPIEHYDTIVLDAVLNNAWNHSSQHATAIYIQDQCVGDFHNAMGGHSPHGFYAHVYINELYWGMYYIHERPDHSWAAEMFGGEKEEYDAIKHSLIYEAINDGGGVGSGTAVSNFYDMLNAADAVQADPTNTAKYNTVCDMLDIDNFITYIMSHWYGVNWDWPSKNWYATHRHPIGKWRFHTWDAEHSLEWYNSSTVRGLSPYSIHDKLNGNAEYRMRFADIVHKAMYNDGPLSYPRSAQIVQARMNQVDRPIVGESARWGDTRVTIPHTREDLFNNLNSVLTGFISPRWSFLYEWLKSVGLYPNVAAPAFRINGEYQHGGEASAGDVLTMDAPSGTIYYTTNGSDPREPWTGNVVGTPYAPITLTKSTHVKARVRDGSTWSALNEATYAVGPVAENLRITEIMYHPKNTGNPSDPNEEYIELKNIGLDTLNLNLVSFTEGVDFTFPDIDLAPGECVVVVRDQSAFQSQYGTGVNTAGHYTGSLANDGERIKLVDAIGRTILDFKYGDGWRPITDGDGFSLTIIDPTDQILYGWEEGLVAHWKFDDGMGSSIAVDSAGTNNGTLNGDTSWTTGRIGGALSFDGSGDYVSLASIGPLEGDKFTAQAWVNVDASAGVWNPVLMQHDLSNDGCYFYIANDKPSFYLIEGGGFAQAASPETLNADQWYHVAATNDGSDLKLYVDGQLKGSGSSAGMTGVNYNAYIGCEPVSLLYYTGLIDDVRIYNRAVSESEFQDISDPMTRWSQKDSWRASVYRNGTPGWDDSGILPNPGAIVINEVMSHSNEGPDWIELYNTTDDPINISGWFLSDNDRDEPNLMKYRIVDGTIIDGDDYLVFYQDTDFNNPGDPGCLVPFALSENGEKVCLSSHLDLSVMLTGYREIEDFGSSATNVSFGRYFKSSTGNFNFVAMDYNTPDSNNAYPRVGPVVINEIMYNPASGNQKEEYIELHNITAAPYTLYRLDKFTPWKFTDGIDLTFSSSPPVTIPPLGYLLVVKDQASFTARYGVISGVQIIEDYDGWLSNSGERLQIGMPGDLDEEGTRYYIRIDRVTYSDGSHPEDCPGGVDLWPTEADGLGKSLSRKVPSAYGNDVANWQASSPSPGTANP